VTDTVVAGARDDRVDEHQVTALADHWFLDTIERGNPDTALDRRRDGRSWSHGNAVLPLVHGSVYFRRLLDEVSRLAAGDLLLFTDWRGDPDERLDVSAGTAVGRVFAAAARRGVDVRGLVWRSHLDRFQFSAAENRHLGEEIDAAGGQCLLDQRVRILGSHHQKLVVLRHQRSPELDVAFIGGIDLCHSRRDGAGHDGDPQPQRMAAVYGARPPWHDVQLEVRGPAVGDAEAVFRERWDDPHLLTRNPLRVMGQLIHREQRRPRPLPPQGVDPPSLGPTAIQLLRTYPVRRPRYPFARNGERSIARAYGKVLDRARHFIYVEDQYLWSHDVAEVFAAALQRSPQLRMVGVIPAHPDQDGRASGPPNLVGREPVLQALREAGGDRVGLYSPENLAGTPVYVHAKVCVVDDEWACVGSDNANRRSWTHDSELSAAFVDVSGTARRLRHQLTREHLGDSITEPELDDPVAWALAFRSHASALDAWYASGGRGTRPHGRIRSYTQPVATRWTRSWATVLYRTVYDPDGRTRSMHRQHEF
jgi:phosphatidylserine/phosphatidylglycerophosphate/cardiolipin synthase-like enzyme